MYGTRVHTRWSWEKLFSYGEVVCFVSAWAIGLLVAMEGQNASNNRSTAHTLAATSDSLGIQANLGR